MSTVHELLESVTPLVAHDKTAALIAALKNEHRQYLFRYGTIDEIIAFPHERLDGQLKLTYHEFINAVYEEAKKRNQIWTMWEIWRRQPTFRTAVDVWFVSKITMAAEYRDIIKYLPFISQQIAAVVFEKVFSVATPQALAETWSHYDWLHFERVCSRPEKGDDDEVGIRYQRGQQVFKEAVRLMSSERYAQFRARIVSPVSLKLGGTDLSLLFR